MGLFRRRPLSPAQVALREAKEEFRAAAQVWKASEASDARGRTTKRKASTETLLAAARIEKWERLETARMQLARVQGIFSAERQPVPERASLKKARTRNPAEPFSALSTRDRQRMKSLGAVLANGDWTFRGENGDLVLGEAGVTIRRGLKGTILQGARRADKFIPYDQITAIQFKAAGVLVGYIQLSHSGGGDAKRGLNEALTDENTVTFQGVGKNVIFAEARDAIASRMSAKTHLSTTESGDGDAATRLCPDCAESVKAAARVCRYCGYRFAPS
jgi:hypothetical protein